MNDLLIVILLGIVEGVTEFLPVSSTGHLILAGSLLGLPEADAVFDIVIQLGAILAVVVLFWRRFVNVAHGLARRDPAAIAFTRNVALGFLPAAVVGAIAYKAIKAVLEAPVIAPLVVAIALIVGGIAILFIERVAPPVRTGSVEAMSWRTALAIGVLQCLAMIPGVSRSGATIMGARAMGVSREIAAEYSFFLAIPTMLGATTLTLWKARHELSADHLGSIAIGFVVSFLVAIVVVRWFMSVVTKHGFQPFAWYRIIAGVVALAALSLR
ncbi:undecaprenyl-diphosphate phosphatase [Sphingomonas sp. TX0543]|uniref:undecaprenyl-diphosphate phosphatase n=1 Tax=unclassified Sphingomonas TaxID=196159 RepID=UPI0010F693F0|nr:undecaprenyl-diphosphate phosphatase [Sphingomonas sp. 3P27F8]